MGDMIRKAFVLRLKPESLDLYIYWHDNIWPELKAEIAKQGIAEVTLYQIDDKVVLFSRIKDEEAWKRLWDTEIHHRWAKERMEPLMHYRDDGVVDAREMREIWHFEPGAAS
jgi:L-rhamnose mutarotase